MLTKLGGIIEKKPWLVVSLVVLVTIGFSLSLPALEFKTDFNDFMPDDEIGLANDRVQEYFGANQLPLFVLVEKKSVNNVISPRAIRDIHSIEQELNSHPKVDGVISITTFLNQICMI